MEHDFQYGDLSNPDPALVAQSEDQSQSHGAELQWDGPLGLSAGGNFTHDRLDHADQLDGARSYTASTEDWGLFAQELLQEGPLKLQATGRYDQTTRAGNFWSPRMESWVDATSIVRLFASAASSFGLPRLADLYTNSPFFTANPQLRPEKSWTVDSGFELHQDSDTFKATYYHAIVSDALQVVPVTLNGVENVADVRRQGVESEWSHVFSRWFQEDLRYTYLENRGRPDGASSPVELAQSPHHRIDWIMTFHPWHKVRVDTDIKYEGLRYAGDNQTGTEFSPQTTFDFRVSWPWRQMDLYLGSENFFNKRYEDYEGYPLPGRTAYGGIQLRSVGANP